MTFTQYSVLSKASNLASMWTKNVFNVHLIRSLCTVVPPLNTVKRGRGRPRRSELVDDVKIFSVENGVDLIMGSTPSLDEVYNETVQEAIEPTTPIVKRGRGRPKRIDTLSDKNPSVLLDASLTSSTSSSSRKVKQTTDLLPGLRFTHVDTSLNGHSTQTSPDGFEYTGEWSDGKPHGTGRLTWPDLSSFEGQFEYGVRSGFGTLTKKWGSMSGNWVDDCLEGEGEMAINSGTTYKGNFHKSLRHGQGTLMYPNGTFYEGAHVNGKREGFGRCTFADGSLVTGEWKDDNVNGEGRLQFPNGKSVCL